MITAGMVVVVVVVVTALVFDFTNGFHDTANAMATSIATGALHPKVAVTVAGVLNLAGAFISVEVAKTISSGLVDDTRITPVVIFAGLVGAILWILVTWLLGMPSSSSHALFGGLIGAALVAGGPDAVRFGNVMAKVVIPAVVSPLLAGLVALAATYLGYWISSRAEPAGGASRVPRGTGGVSINGRARPRCERRAEDDGRDHALADYGRRARPRLRPTLLGNRVRWPGHRLGDVSGRLADHPDPR